MKHVDRKFYETCRQEIRLTSGARRITITTIQFHKVILRGRVKFPTGGDYDIVSVRDPSQRNAVAADLVTLVRGQIVFHMG